VSLWLVAIACAVGFSIGTVGVGGILLIPPLTWLARISIHEAAATALFTFLFTGLYGTWLYQKRGSIDWRLSVPVCAGAVLFSYVGAWVNSLVGAAALNTIIAVVIALAGFYILLPLAPKIGSVAQSASTPHMALLLGVGAVSGFGSGLSGAGGPLFSVPIMLLLGFAPLTTIGVSQVLQIIAAAFGSLGNLHYGSINFTLGAILTACELAGVFVGVRYAHRAKVAHLRAMVGWVCIVVGGGMLLRLL
jgi:uncharacterized protein